MPPKWDDDKVAALRKGVEEGSTYGELTLIPALEGFSRNALIGKAQRIGLANRDRVEAGRHAAARQKAKADADDRKAALARRESATAANREAARALLASDPAAKAAQAAIAAAVTGRDFASNIRAAKADEIEAAKERVAAEAKAEPPARTGSIGWDQVESGVCKMPLWKTYTSPSLDEMRFCGAKAELGQAWCASCRKIAYNSPPARTGTVQGRAA
ncbi:MAG: hypothetical protein DI527_00430 [Chelatococcus sp.]|nr:MAG: hypothetical protein DI527_00430 [Chelatococcus sp.]